jgi:hypothetical protein
MTIQLSIYFERLNFELLFLDRITGYIAIQESFGRLEAGPTVEPASSRQEKNFMDKYNRIHGI